MVVNIHPLCCAVSVVSITVYLSRKTVYLLLYHCLALVNKSFQYLFSLYFPSSCQLFSHSNSFLLGSASSTLHFLLAIRKCITAQYRVPENSMPFCLLCYFCYRLHVFSVFSHAKLPFFFFPASHTR